MADTKTLAVKLTEYTKLHEESGLVDFAAFSRFSSHKQADGALRDLQEAIFKAKGGEVTNLDAEETIEKVSEGLSEETPAKPKEISEKDLQTADLINTVVSAANLENTEWYSTGAWIMTFKSRFGTEAKGNRQVAYGILDAAADISGAVPEEDFNYKNEMVTLRKKDGSVKWSGWAKTRRFTQNLADIFKAIEKSGWDKVFPNGSLVKRPEVIELGKDAKVPEPALDTVVRSLNMAIQKVQQCDHTDKESLEALQDMIADLNETHMQWIKGDFQGQVPE